MSRVKLNSEKTFFQLYTHQPFRRMKITFTTMRIITIIEKKKTHFYVINNNTILNPKSRDDSTYP